MPAKKRLDLLILEKGLASSRQRAQALIMAGKVFVDTQRIDKPGIHLPDDVSITIKDDDQVYVSRGGLKLQAALEALHLNVRGLTCMDVGASTGGFTDCLLKHGARRVYAVDVGYGQLAWQLRQDPRVIPIERTNIRHMNPDRLPEKVELATIDASFISLKVVVPPVRRFLTPDGKILALIKPQFEVGKGKVGKGGVVKDAQQHAEVIRDLTVFFTELGFECGSVVPSPIQGPKGNQEFMILLSALSMDNSVL
jgi:23S rRNA (cytidine1920-2'-O)/16S rRNA (cytidine1409-2'-O)-methyltransferase